jgi:hypothetical protein
MCIVAAVARPGPKEAQLCPYYMHPTENRILLMLRIEGNGALHI